MEVSALPALRPLLSSRGEAPSATPSRSPSRPGGGTREPRRSAGPPRTIQGLPIPPAAPGPSPEGGARRRGEAAGPGRAGKAARRRGVRPSFPGLGPLGGGWAREPRRAGQERAPGARTETHTARRAWKRDHPYPALSAPQPIPVPQTALWRPIPDPCRRLPAEQRALRAAPSLDPKRLAAAQGSRRRWQTRGRWGQGSYSRPLPPRWEDRAGGRLLGVRGAKAGRPELLRPSCPPAAVAGALLEGSGPLPSRAGARLQSARGAG